MMKRYCQILILTTAGLLLGGAMLVILADPRGLLRPFWNNPLHIPALEARGGRMEKSLHAMSRGYEIYLLGSSRVQVGLNPRSPTLRGASTYNLGLSATSTPELNKIIRALSQKERPPAHIIYGLDFESFNANRGLDPEFSESWFARPGHLRWLPRYLLSPGNIRKSLELLATGRSVHDDVYSDRHGLLDKTTMASSVHHHRLFSRVLTTNYLLRRETFANYQYGADQMEDTFLALRQAMASGTRITLFISPIHAWHIFVMDELDLTEQYQQWKRELVAMTGRLAASHGTNIRLWDFGTVNTVTSEHVPREKRPMRFFWESSHYKLATGDLMLNLMLNEKLAAVHADFGVRLTADLLDQHLETARSRLDTWKRQHPADLAEIRQMIRDTADKRRPALQ